VNVIKVEGKANSNCLCHTLKENNDDERKEVFVILPSNAIVQPFTMMVESVCASVTLTAMFCCV
jgi:hypothetical protein